MKNRTTVERKSERELVVMRTVNGPARIVFEAWTKPELFRQWWVPKSMGMSLLSCEMDVRVGGRYRLVFGHDASPKPMEFFGRYLEVTPHSRAVQGKRLGCPTEQACIKLHQQALDRYNRCNTANEYERCFALSRDEERAAARRRVRASPTGSVAGSTQRDQATAAITVGGHRGATRRTRRT